MKKWIVLFVPVAVLLVAILLYPRAQKYFFRPRVASPPAQNSVENLTPTSASEIDDIQLIADDLAIPWEIVFLPDGDLLVTERVGTLVRIDGESKSRFEVNGVRHVGEGGLLGMALDPDFVTNEYIYLYLTSQSDGNLENRVERYRYRDDLLSDRVVILDDIPGASNHDGGKIEFGPDGKLYISTGDAQSADAAQDTDSLSGKILRIEGDGSIPADNPYGNEVWSYGHRNPQGIAWDSTDRLWSSEHGPSGLETGNDEINLIEKGENYGWPLIRGTQTSDGMRTPVIESGKSDTWAPGAVAIVSDRLFFTGLRGEALYSADIEGGQLTNFQKHLFGQYGRLRALKAGPEGFLYVSTSNTDGRGDSRSGDDRIVRINPQVLE